MRRTRTTGWIVISILLVLALIMLWPGFPALGADSGAAVSASRALAEAEGLMARVSSVSGAGSRSASSETAWAGAAPGEPLLLYSIDGKPTSYVVPVLDSSGKVISTIGVSASTGKWSWYSGVSQPRFPLVSASEATARVRSFLRERGIEASPAEPQARVAPDKNTYWFFELGNDLPIKEVYLPVFVEGKPSSDLDGKPWLAKTATAKPEASAAQQPPNGGLVSRTEAPASGAAGSSAAAPPLYPGGAPSSYNIAGVPYHAQQTDYWCGPASLEMNFDYWGEDVPQTEISDVVNATPSSGCYNADLVRAGHFSQESTAIANPSLRGYTSRWLGYGSAHAYWNDSSLYDRRYSDLKSLISQNIPVLILTYYDTPPSSGHFRLVKGYDDNIGTFIVNDPWYTPPYQGPDVNFSQSFLVDNLWTYSNRWGMISMPWNVSVAKPTYVSAGQVFNVTASVDYRGPSPLAGQYPCMTNSPTATFESSGSYQVIAGEINQVIPGIDATGSSGAVTWTVKALATQKTSNIQVVAQGLIDGSSYSYSSYSDWIGGIGAEPPWQPTSRTWGHDSVGASSPATTWYLAEGSTNGGFETWVLVQNPNDHAANVNLQYMTPSGPVAGPSYTLSANSRKSFFVADTVPNQWSVSTKVTSDRAVIAERSMYWGGYREGSNSIGVTARASTWYLPEGCTAGGMESWVLVQNPNGSAAHVSLTYMTPSGPVQGPAATIAANSRKTFSVADTVPNQWSVSTKVTSDTPVIAERSMYGTSGGVRTWGHDSVGVKAASSRWYLAEGCTNGGFETWVLVQNPSSSAAHVSLTYMTPDGPVTGPSKTLAANSRQTFNVAESVPGAWAVSTEVTSDVPVIAERAMYGGGRTWGHDSIGASSPSTDWYLAEGCTQTGFETWVLVQNPNNSAVTVTLTYMTAAGQVNGPVVSLAANSRTTFNVAEAVPLEWEVSTHVHVDAGAGVIAERAMYGDPR